MQRLEDAAVFLAGSISTVTTTKTGKGDRVMENMMEYKGYHAKIEYSAEDDAFVGKIFGIIDTLVFEGQSIEELRTMFHQSVDDYLALCREIGKAPDREYRGTFNVRLPSELHRQAALAAEAMDISLNQYVADALRHYAAADGV